MSGPLLVVDGDSFAHRAYHSVPKSVRRGNGKGGGAIVGFANRLLGLYDSEKPRAVPIPRDHVAPIRRGERPRSFYRAGLQAKFAASSMLPDPL